MSEGTRWSKARPDFKGASTRKRSLARARPEKYELTRDMCPEKPDKNLLEIRDSTVTVTVNLIPKESIDKSIDLFKNQRIAAAVNAVLKRYQKIIQKEVKEAENKCRTLEKRSEYALDFGTQESYDELQKGKEKIVEATNMTMKKAIQSLQRAVDDRIENLKSRAERDDKNLKEARIKGTVSWSLKGLALVLLPMSIASLVTPAAPIGGAVLVPTAEALAPQIAQAPFMIMDGIKYVKVVREKMNQEQRYRKKFLDRLDKVIKQEWGRLGRKTALANLEASRKKYRNYVTSLRWHVERLAKKMDKLNGEIQTISKKGTTTLSKRQQSDLKKKQEKLRKREAEAWDWCRQLIKAENQLDKITFKMTQAGLRMDDRTIREKIKSLKNWRSAWKGVESVADVGFTTADLISAAQFMTSVASAGS